MRLPMLMIVTLLTAGFASACDDDEGSTTKRNPSKETADASAGDEPSDDEQADETDSNDDDRSTGSAGKGGSQAAAGSGGSAGGADSAGGESAAGKGGSGGAAGSPAAAGNGEAGAAGSGEAGAAAAGAGGVDAAGSGAAGAAGSAPPANLPKQFVFATAITTGDDSNTYVKTIDSLEPGEFDTSKAREFGGFTDIGVIDRWLFTSNDESPVITRFTIEADGSFKQDQSVSFANYGSGAPLYYNAFVSKTKAYVLTDSGEYVVWNPTKMEIEGTIPLPKIADRNGIEITPSLDRGMVVRGNRLFHAYAWTDYENYITTPQSMLIVIDTETDEVVNQIEAPCPDLDGGTLDEAGNLYFSNWTFAPPGTLLVDNGPKTCVVKIPADKEEIDPTFKLTFSDLTGGHEGAAFRYIGNGKALFSVFYEDHTPYDPMSEDIASWVFGDNWRFMRVDLATQQAETVEDIGWSVGGYYPTRVGDDTYLLVQVGDDTTLYQLTPDNKATEALTTKGWATRLIPLL